MKEFELWERESSRLKSEQKFDRDSKEKLFPEEKFFNFESTN